MEPSQLIETPVIQWGFAGFCLLLLAIIVWLITKLIAVQRQTNDVVARNTEVIHDLGKTSTDTLLLLRNVHEKLLSRPCIAREE